MPDPRNNSTGLWQQFANSASPHLPDALGTVGGAAGTSPQQYASSYAGPQPTFLQREIASPGGRIGYDVLHGLESGAQFGSRLLDYTPLSGLAPFAQAGANQIANATNDVYQNALSANRNAPGYAAQYQKFQQGLAQQDANTLDQLVPALESGLSGMVVGLTQGPDAGNAYMDAMTDKLNAFAKANPVRSAAANLAGGFLTDKLPSASDPLGTLKNVIANLPAVTKAAAANPAISKKLTQAGQAISKLGDHLDKLSKLSNANDLGDAIDQAGGDAPESAPSASQQTLAPQNPDSHDDFPSAQAGSLDFTGLTPGGFDASLSGQFAMFGNPRLRPEIFGDDSGVTFLSLPNAPAPAGMGVNLQEPNYLQKRFSGGAAPTFGVNLNPGYGDTSQFSGPDISLTS